MENKTEIWKGIFNQYKEVQCFTKYDLVNTHVLARKAASSSCREQGGYGDCEYFHDDETHTYFYNFSFTNLEALAQSKDPSKLERYLVLAPNNSGRSDEKIAAILLGLLHESRKITHIVISDEEHTHRGRNFVKAEVYELGEG